MVSSSPYNLFFASSRGSSGSDFRSMQGLPMFVPTDTNEGVDQVANSRLYDSALQHPDENLESLCNCFLRLEYPNGLSSSATSLESIAFGWYVIQTSHILNRDKSSTVQMMLDEEIFRIANQPSSFLSTRFYKLGIGSGCCGSHLSLSPKSTRIQSTYVSRSTCCRLCTKAGKNPMCARFA